MSARLSFQFGVMQVLMATELKRTDSMVSPALFHFQDHFDFEHIIGRSSMSEVLAMTRCFQRTSLRSGPIRLQMLWFRSVVW